MAEPVKLSRERWEMLTRGEYGRQHWTEGDLSNGPLKLPFLLEINGITFLPAEYVPAERKISLGEQSAIRAHEYLYGKPQRLGR